MRQSAAELRELQWRAIAPEDWESHLRSALSQSRSVSAGLLRHPFVLPGVLSQLSLSRVPEAMAVAGK
jgi:hypothetical protein